MHLLSVRDDDGTLVICRKEVKQGEVTTRRIADFRASSQPCPACQAELDAGRSLA